MNIPIKILLSNVPEPTTGNTWNDVFSNWETYSNLWENTNAQAGGFFDAPILDMYGDEGISIKDVVKDLSDPSKLFTGFSKQFTVPASKKNNKLFKHYYNIDITNGLDTRETIPARILLNNTTYKVGNISVEGVKMSNGVPMSYKIRFYGKLSELAKRIGKDELSYLDWSSYDVDSIGKEEFSTNTVSDVVFPLATLEDRYIVDSTNRDAAVGLNKTRNIRFVDSTRSGEDYGFSTQEMVGAIRVGAMLDNISNAYGITFSGVFLDTPINDLFFWLNKVDKERENEATVSKPQSFSPAPTISDVSISGGTITLDSQHTQGYTHEISFRPISTISNFTVDMKVNGTIVETVTTSNVPSQYFDSVNPNVVTFEVSTTGTGTVELQVLVRAYDESDEYNPPETQTFISTVTVGDQSYFIADHLPKMKVMDFLSSIFKMFNVVAEVDADLDVKAEYFDYYMSKGKTIDISEWTHVGSYDINKSNLYSGLDFAFSEPKTALEIGYEKVNSKEYGALNYQLLGEEGYKLSGDTYKIHLKNQRIPLENIQDIATDLVSGICYTQFSNLESNKQQTKPSFTYVVKNNTGVTSVAWDNGSTIEQITNYLSPSNIHVVDFTRPSGEDKPFFNGLYFSNELSEYNTTIRTEGSSLWNYFYKGITSMMFDDDKRSAEFNATIPAGILVDLSLSDTLIISNNYYSISSMETNYLTGVTKFKLTLVGKAKMRNFTAHTISVQNPNGSLPMRITYLSQSGSLVSQILPAQATEDIDLIGDVIYSSEVL